MLIKVKAKPRSKVEQTQESWSYFLGEKDQP